MLKKMRAKSNPGKIKFYADENVDYALVQYLRRHHKVNIASAIELGYSKRDDDFHFKEAKKRGRFLLTCDRDYLNHSKYPFNQMVGTVILDVPATHLGLGWISLWLGNEVVPSGKGISGTKIVLHVDTIDFYFPDDTGKIIKQTLSTPKSTRIS